MPGRHHDPPRIALKRFGSRLGRKHKHIQTHHASDEMDLADAINVLLCFHKISVVVPVVEDVWHLPDNVL